ncbi:MAG: IS200/IS605 family transposase [Planctomycetes bacterium]|nr:IS200/IS605 family transposase [Planctomycetota bacterium]
MGDSYHACHYHLIFACKDRQPLLTDAILSELFSYVHGLLDVRESLLIKGGGIADHVHLLIRVPPKHAPSDVIRDIKANSSRWIREKWPKVGFAWQDGYGLFTVSMSLIAKTKEYIEKQAEHHRKMTFLDELKRYLKNHEISFETRFLEGGDDTAGDAPSSE